MESIRVYNETRHYYLKHRRAVEGVERFSFAWVKFGISVRDLTLGESIAARLQQRKQPEGLVYWVEGKEGESISKPMLAELPNVMFRPVESALWSRKGSAKLCRITNHFAMSSC